MQPFAERDHRRDPMIRLALILAFLVSASTATLAQDEEPAADPFGSPSVDTETKWTPTHPDGDTPQDRMLSLAHTDALARFDRIELYAVSMPKPFGDEEPKREPTESTFPVRPYGVYADIHAHKTIRGAACDELRTTWQSLAFDRLGGAFCHHPVYGFRLYRDDDLLFETTVCWECQNFYVPRYDPDKRRYTHGWYGFANDDNAKSLLKLLRSLLPHPKL